MLKKKVFGYLLLSVLVCILPVSCDVQKRRYLPGYFVQNKNTPDKYRLPLNYAYAHTPIGNFGDTLPIALYPSNPLWANPGYGSPIIKKKKKTTDVLVDSTQLRNNRISAKEPYTEIIAQPKKATGFNDEEIKQAQNNETVLKNEDNSTIAEHDKDTEYKNLILAFLSGAGSVLLLSAMRNGIKKYKRGKLNEPGNSSPEQEIANIADRLDRCADRFANAENVRTELAARKTAIAINKCNTVEEAKKLEKSFNSTYLSPAQASDLQHITTNNLLSNDMGYGGGSITLKPDVVATDGGFYKNNAGSLSWTMGEPITETISDGNNTLTQGFQQGSYLTVSVNEVDQTDINISVYPNPFVSILNIKSDHTDPFNVEAIDMQGNVVSTQSFENGQGQIDFSNLPEAIYLLRITNKDGKQLKVFKIQKVD